MSTYNVKLIKLYTLKMCLLCINHSSIKPLKKEKEKTGWPERITKSEKGQSKMLFVYI